MLAVRSAAAR